MTILAYSHTLVAGAPENINDVQDMFGDIRTVVNGNLDATNFAATAKPATLMGAFRTVGQASIAVAAGATAGTYYAANGSPVASGVASGGLVPTAIPVIGADHFVSGLTAQYRVEAAWITNATAPAVTLTLGLYPITSVAGGASSVTVTLGTVASGSTVALTTPAAGSSGTVASSDFTLSSSGAYLLGYVNSGTTAASSFTTLGLTLRVHNV